MYGLLQPIKLGSPDQNLQNQITPRHNVMVCFFFPTPAMFLKYFFSKSSLNCHCRWQLNLFFGGNQNRFPGDSWLCILFGTTALAVPHLDPDGRCLNDFGRVENYRVPDSLWFQNDVFFSWVCVFIVWF